MSDLSQAANPFILADAEKALCKCANHATNVWADGNRGHSPSWTCAMSEPVDVQAERLRADELSIRLATYAEQVPTVLSVHNLREDLRAASALLAGQAEQIDQLKKERYEAQLGWQNAQSATYDSHLAAVCQRDNLRDAAEQMMRRAQLVIEDWRELQAALRAAAVGEDE